MRSLLVMTRAGVFTAAFGPRAEITLGRARESDVVLDEPRVSRHHARLVAEGDTVRLVDLGSTNGTLLGGERVAPHVPVEVALGVMITLGSSVVVVQEASDRAEGRIWSEAELASRCDAERESALACGTMFALVSVRLRPRLVEMEMATARKFDRGQDHTREVKAALAETCRPSDVVGSCGSASFFVLLPRTAPDAAERIGAILRARLDDRSLRADVGVACFPRDGDTRAKLQTAAAARATAPEVVEPPPPSRQLDHGFMARLAPVIDRLAAGTISVLVLGETGVGKEVLARSIHERSPRARGPLLCINCAALSETLLEAELFGYERGAFTGAAQAKAGLIESAEGGTVFLDELGEMPPSLQAKLLRVIEQREVVRIGALRPRPIDVRFISATHRDLAADVAAGRFRQDLYFRLDGTSLTLPPLRERVSEIPALAREFLRFACQASGRTPVLDLTASALALLERYSWPGNIRELRNMMERAVVLCTSDVVSIADLPVEAMGNITRAPAQRPPETSPRSTMPPPVDDESYTPTSGETALAATHDERARIAVALKMCAGNQTQAAKVLGMSRRTLVTRLEEYRLPRPRKQV